ncbi:MAG: hypothetical protein Q9187_000055 [Circinaria calcarea]
MGLDDWKYRAPYKVHDNDPNFKVVYEGGCHCGRVKYQLSRDKPLDSKYCHCTTCQTLHGAPFQWASIFHKDDINFTHGHHDLGWCHIFYSHRVVDIPDGKPKWSEMNDQSDLIEDSPSDAKRRKREQDEKSQEEEKRGEKNGEE